MKFFHFLYFLLFFIVMDQVEEYLKRVSKRKDPTFTKEDAGNICAHVQQSHYIEKKHHKRLNEIYGYVGQRIEPSYELDQQSDEEEMEIIKTTEKLSLSPFNSKTESYSQYLEKNKKKRPVSPKRK